MRSYLLVALALVGTSANTNGCAADKRGLQSCQAETPIVDVTSMLQVTNFKKAEPGVGLAETSIEDASSCPLLTDAVWAAMDTYVEVDFPAALASDEAKSYGEKLKSAFWKLEGSWLALNKTTPEKYTTSDKYMGLMKDADYTGLWVKDGSCLLAFRGSDSQIDCGILPDVPEEYKQYGNKPGAPNGVQWDAVEFHGLQVHLGVKVELESLLAKMQSTDGLATVKNKCTNGLTLTGHSLGGGTSQLMATLLNKNGDPLGAGLTVDHVFGFGPMPFSKDKPAVNDKSPDGCFAGGMYANVAHLNEDDIPEVDLVWQMLTAESLRFRHVKASHHLMVTPSSYQVTECGEDPPYPFTGRSVKVTPMMPTHAQSEYVKKVGCPKD